MKKFEVEKIRDFVSGFGDGHMYFIWAENGKEAFVFWKGKNSYDQYPDFWEEKTVNSWYRKNRENCPDDWEFENQIEELDIDCLMNEFSFWESKEEVLKLLSE